MSSIRCSALVCLALALVSPVVAQGNWSGEAGFLTGHHDNFFYRSADSNDPGSDLISIYGDLEYERKTGPSKWTLSAHGEGVFVSDIDDADYQGVTLEGEHSRGPTKLSLSASTFLNRLFVEEGDPVFFDTQEVELWARRSLSPRLWVRAKVELANWDFDPVEDDRDADILKVSVTARFALTERVAVRGSVLFEDRDATGPDNNRDGDGFALALELRPRDRIDVFLRVRSRDRDYRDAPVGDRNFDRQDTTFDLNLNVRWQRWKDWGIQLREYYRDGDSTRPDRNYTGNSLEIGTFFKF